MLVQDSHHFCDRDEDGEDINFHEREGLVGDRKNGASVGYENVRALVYMLECG